MSAKNGKPCKKCGANEWTKRGDCLPCKRAFDKIYKRKNREKIKESDRAYKQAHADKIRIRQREYNRKNSRLRSDATQARFHRERAEQRGGGGSFTAGEWRSLIKRYGGKCLCCGKTDVKLTVDHVIPLVRGGTSNIDNIQPLCSACNIRKRDVIIDYRPESESPVWVQPLLFTIDRVADEQAAQRGGEGE